MSEETNQFNGEQKCSCKKLTILVMVTMLFSIATFLLTLTNTLLPANVAQGGAKAPGEEQPAVVISKQYDKGQSMEKALATKKPMVVFFYTDWCGYCQKFAPTFHKVATSKAIKKAFAIAYVNCDAPENSKYMQEYNVQGFPTVYVVKGDKKTQLENNTFFTDTAEKDLPAKMLEIIK
ncbi:thioredoxin fold domain-containing protein [bacterium]|nr:thioredoxin fold domain-containing protein [bacterium]